MEETSAFDFSFEVTGKIWQLAIDETSGQIGVEVRDEDQKVAFLLFNPGTLEVSEYIYLPQADWWTTLVKLRSGHFFLDKYLDPQDPTQKSLLTFSIDSPSEVSELEDFQLDQITNKELQGHSVRDHSDLKVVDLSELNLVLSVGENSKIQYPKLFHNGAEVFDLCREYLEKEIYHGVEYYEEGEVIIISYYERSGAKFDRKILVIRDGVEIVHQTQDENLDGYASGAFLLINDFLIFISKSNQINGIRI